MGSYSHAASSIRKLDIPFSVRSTSLSTSQRNGFAITSSTFHSRFAQVFSVPVFELLYSLNIKIPFKSSSLCLLYHGLYSVMLMPNTHLLWSQIVLRLWNFSYGYSICWEIWRYFRYLYDMSSDLNDKYIIVSTHVLFGSFAFVLVYSQLFVQNASICSILRRHAHNQQATRKSICASWKVFDKMSK